MSVANHNPAWPGRVSLGSYLFTLWIVLTLNFVLPLYYTARVVVYNADVFDNWYYTPGGYGGGIPMPYNKHEFIVGLPDGLTIRGTP